MVSIDTNVDTDAISGSFDGGDGGDVDAGEGGVDLDTGFDGGGGDDVGEADDPETGDTTTDRLRDDAESDPLNPQTETTDVGGEPTGPGGGVDLETGFDGGGDAGEAPDPGDVDTDPGGGDGGGTVDEGEGGVDLDTGFGGGGGSVDEGEGGVDLDTGFPSPDDGGDKQDQPPGGGPETIEDPEPAPTPDDVVAEPGGTGDAGDINERISTPNRPDPLDETGEILDEDPDQPGVQLPPLGGGPPQTPGADEAPPSDFEGPDPTDDVIQAGETFYPGAGIFGSDGQGLERRRRFDELPEEGGGQGLEATGTGDEQAIAQDLEDEFLANNPQFDESDIRVTREGDTFRTELTASGEVTAARDIESRVLESAPGLGEEDIAVQRRDDGRFFTRITGQGEERIVEIQRERAAEAIDEQVIDANVTPEDVRPVAEPGLPGGPQSGQTAGFTLTEGAVQDIRDMRVERIVEQAGAPAGGFQSVRGGTPTRSRLISSPSGGFRSVRGGTPETPSPRASIELQLEGQLDTELNQSDITFEQTDEGLVGRPTPEATERARREASPLSQLAEGTPLEGLFETGAEVGGKFAGGRTRRRTEFFDAVGQADAAEGALRDAGAGGLIDAYRGAQTEAQAALGGVREGVVSTGREAGERLGTAALFLGAGPASAGLERAGVDVDPSDVPDPAERPEAFAAAAAPFAAAEPTPLGELAVGGAIAGAAVLSARGRVQRRDIGSAQARATAEPPGLFPPEQEQPSEPIGRGFFPSEQEVEPSSIDLPELLPPTEQAAGEGTPRLTPPEIETPSRPARKPFPPEQEQPTEPISRGFFEDELDVPTARTGSALQQVGEGEGQTRRSRRRGRRRSQLPSEFIPDQPSVIGEIGGGAGQVSDAPGPSFIFRPNPRSMELRRIETEEGGFRVGPEFTRFLGAQTLDRTLEPEVTPFGGFGTLPPAEAAGGEFAAASTTGLTERQAELGVDERARADTLPDIMSGSRVDTGTPQDVATSPLSLEDTVQDQRLGQRARFADPFEQTTPDLSMGPEFGAEFAEFNATVTEPFAFDFGFDFPTGRRRPRPDIDVDRREDEPTADIGEAFVERRRRDLINPFTGE